MKSDLSLSPDAIKGAVAKLLGRFHLVLYTIVVIGGLAVTVFFLYQIVIQATDIPAPTTSTSSSFDQATIKKLKALNEKSGGGDPLQLPSNQRINPFVN